MKKPIEYIDRSTQKREQEQVYYEALVRFFYGKSWLGKSLANLTSRYAFCSHLCGWWQNRAASRKKIVPFINKYKLDSSEFLDPVESFESFNAFFYRKLKKESRPLASSPLVMPADGRYLVYPDVDACDGFIVKGDKFSLADLVGSAALAVPYQKGSLVLARLCPTDYHRFHFPCAGIPSLPRLVNGWLYSVNPIAIKQNIHRFTENKRSITALESEQFGKVLVMEIGATNVGSIHQTYAANQPYRKGDEKGFFAFGGSAMILLFEPNRVRFDQDLIDHSKQHIETRCLLGQSLGQPV